MFVYCLPPIDWWPGWITQSEYKAEIIKWHGHDLHVAADEWDKFLEFRTQAYALAKKLGWEGDIRGGDEPDVAPLPAESNCTFMLGWKQDNNGTTFIASPYELPWLDKHAFAKTQV